MHEAALAQGILDIVEEQAARTAFTRVRRVCVEIGRLSHVEPQALAFGFEAASRGTIAEGARLDIDQPPGRGHCMACGEVVSVAAHGDPCPECGSHQWLLIGGDEMRVRELEVD
jgi:hydrogenase nickel incorporation protein HypA/HybF